MPGTPTTNYGLIKGTIGGDKNTWGQQINDNADSIDTQMKVNEDAAEAADVKGQQGIDDATTAQAGADASAKTAGDTMTGQLILPTSSNPTEAMSRTSADQWFMPNNLASYDSDLDTIATTDAASVDYHLGSSVTNAPSAIAATVGDILLHRGVDADNGTQIYLDPTSNVTYTRHKIATVWGSWVALVNTDTLPTGSTAIVTTNQSWRITEADSSLFILECWGKTSGNIAHQGNSTVTFGKTFQSAPTVTVSVSSVSTAGAQSWCSAIGTTSAKIHAAYFGGASIGPGQYHAIGEWDGVS